LPWILFLRIFLLKIELLAINPWKRCGRKMWRVSEAFSHDFCNSIRNKKSQKLDEGVSASL
jgi:hypothetical protein